MIELITVAGLMFMLSVVTLDLRLGHAYEAILVSLLAIWIISFSRFEDEDPGEDAKRGEVKE